MDTHTLEISPFNSGVFGVRIAGLTYFNHDKEVAVIGPIVGFQQNPGVNINQIGACTADGANCYPLGVGLRDYSRSGNIVAFDEMLYAIYQNASKFVKVVTFNTSVRNADQEWKAIFSTDQIDYGNIVLQVYLGSVWLFGWVPTPNNLTVSAARWNSEENSWNYYLSSHVPDVILTPSLPVRVTVSPDGVSAFMYFTPDNTASSQAYFWNNTAGDWEFYENAPCKSQVVAALNDGVLVGCINLIYELKPGGTTVLPGLNCVEGLWDPIIVSSQSQLYAFCQVDIVETYLYNLNTYQAITNGSIIDLEQVVVKLQSMCVYGPKIFISGLFQKVGNILAYRAAIWDSNEQRWYSVFQEKVTVCYCATDGNILSGVCTQWPNPPLMVRDWSNSDSGNFSVISGTEIFNITELENSSYVTGIAMDESDFVYITTSNGFKRLSLSRWSEDGGLEFVTIAGGNYLNQVLVLDNTAFLTGKFWLENSSVPLSSARFNLLNNSWMDMDQLHEVQGDQVDLGQVGDLVYFATLDTVYACGLFNRAGNMRVGNIAGFNMQGEAVDSVAGGVPTKVYLIQPVSDRLYILTQRPDCPDTMPNNCGTLLYYDTLLDTYSYIITQGIGIIAGGDWPDESSDENDDKFLDHWWGKVLVISGAIFGIFFMTFLGLLLYQKVWNRKRLQYQEIPEIAPNHYFASVESADEINFQTEDFVMKSVLGRGAYGTVWSCVFPHREGRTYAVKQLLLSAGEVKRIEVVKKEIEILEKFRHPHIVHYCGYRVDERPSSVEFFIFMELYDQPCSLKGVIQKKLKKAEKVTKKEWFTYEEIKNYLFQIADGLNYLHKNGVAHRDLKCANILVRTKGSVIHTLHIADFGISRVMTSEEGSANVMASTVLGTPSFMAPEIFSNQPYDALKADIWSFGMLIYEMLAWKEPQTPGKKPEIPKEVTEFLNTDNRFLSILELFNKCAQIEPNLRPTATEVLFYCENLP